ncbi:hypothetical protein [Microbacterium sp.]|uniref:hypothetical protein n=1 Tax=Microbacterium sp. TaxID=51671 RepID=UPI00263690EC|nr:hypothetical protein [Microbacterium sp.]
MSTAALNSASAWEVVPMGHNTWCICDRARAHSEAERLIAYVDQNELGTFDVLWLLSPCPTRSRYVDLDELLADLDAAVLAAAVPRSSRPIPIAHFPPSR